MQVQPQSKPRLAAVSYLNTAPLVWGMQCGPQAGDFDLQFCVPSECARRIEAGTADIGIVPTAEIQRQNLEIVPGTGIACHGAVRTILLISKVEPRKIRTLAADSGSRTSVQLARIILRENYGVAPVFFEHAPHLDPMLAVADAALVIGDAAFQVNPQTVPFLCLDLGAEWVTFTGLPMVFAMWAGRPEVLRRFDSKRLGRLFSASLNYGMLHLDEIVARESVSRQLAPDLVRHYLTRNIVFHIGEREMSGVSAFQELSQDVSQDLSMLRSETVPSL